MDSVAKGPVTRCLDDLSVRPDARERLVALRQGIIGLRDQSYRGLEGVFATHLFPGFYNAPQTEHITRYLETNWFSQATGWWPAFQPIAPIYAIGLLQTLALSLSGEGTPRPIDSYWIIDHDQVELINLANPRQVTLLIATPSPPELALGGILSESSEAWVTLRRAGRTANEIDPTTGQPGPGDTDLRVRTFKIESRAFGPDIPSVRR
jgi:hypothetical protein